MHYNTLRLARCGSWDGRITDGYMGGQRDGTTDELMKERTRPIIYSSDIYVFLINFSSVYERFVDMDTE